MAPVVLIAFAEDLHAIQKGDLIAALAFPADQAIAALDVIERQLPRVVVLEQKFAASSLGVALIERIRGNPTLHGCGIRIISHHDCVGAVPLDMTGTRRAPRYNVVDGVLADVDGKPVTVLDVSIVGALVLSPSPLRPNQRIRFTFMDKAGTAVRLQSAVASVSLEIFEGRPRYKAGIEFFAVDEAAVQGFIDAKKK